MRRHALIAALLCAGIAGAATPSYEVVIAGGRVMDPESGLDAVRNVGIRTVASNR